ncbi:MAG TPA: hypothetical protein VHE78_04595 [Gemmatimonadaceae bacterium]|nr:hypothetical protein [Gemmatimonadaceae bacterium]
MSSPIDRRNAALAGRYEIERELGAGSLPSAPRSAERRLRT